MSKEYLEFVDCLDNCDVVELSDSELKGIVAMAGYCIYKNFASFQNCKGCVDLISSDKTLDIEVLSSHYDYLKGLDRRSLKWPSEDWLNCAVEGAKVFKTLINQEQSEKNFISVVCPRYSLRQLIVKRLLDLELCRVCVVCEDFSYSLIERCLYNLINIFRNNYRKF